ncbi:rod shape-determining protein MreC [Streptosporangium sp. KLBMP 9127]|nr:rod shape-determining protein MreC [Streptosporangium sp. KLBMP 9127]
MRDTRRARLILGLLLAAALVLMTVDHRAGPGSPLGPLRGFGSTVFGTAEQAVTSVTRPVGDLFNALVGAPGAQGRLKELQAENQRLKSRLAEERLAKENSAELRKVLGVAGLGSYTIVAGRVVARRGLPGFEDTVEIDAGSVDGVRPEMTVLNGEGLVGRVVQVGPTTSTVLLLSDPASSAGARLEGGNEVGVVNGVGESGRLVRLRLLDPTAALMAGTRIVSFGSQRGAPYVPGVPIGVIERVESTPGELTRVAYARPFADLTALDVVGVVVRAPARDPRDAVLPRSPRAAAETRARMEGAKDKDGTPKAEAGEGRPPAGRTDGGEAVEDQARGREVGNRGARGFEARDREAVEGQAGGGEAVEEQVRGRGVRDGVVGVRGGRGREVRDRGVIEGRVDGGVVVEEQVRGRGVRDGAAGDRGGRGREARDRGVIEGRVDGGVVVEEQVRGRGVRDGAAGDRGARDGVGRGGAGREFGLRDGEGLQMITRPPRRGEGRDGRGAGGTRAGERE